MSVSREGFVAYLVKQTWNISFPPPIKVSSSQIINWYCSDIDKISKQFDVDVWHLTDETELGNFINAYSRSEEYILHENQNDRTLDALKRWAEYVGQAATEAINKTYLLTWNPANSNEGGDSGVQVGIETRWSCHSRKPQIGDRVYVIRLGVEPKGIIASGVVTRESFEDADWRDATKTRHYIEFLPVDAKPEQGAGMLTMPVLEQLKSQANVTFKWSAQSSGVEIPSALAELVHAAWQGTELPKHGKNKYADRCTT